MKPFTDILREFRKGAIVSICTTKLIEVVQAVQDVKKSGSLTITIGVHPSKHGGNELELTAEVRAKVPEAPLPSAVFFADSAGDLHRTDPNQTEMELDEMTERRQRTSAET